MKGELVTKRYALALYEAAEQRNCLTEVTADVALIDKLINESTEIKKFCSRLDLKKKTAVDFVETAFIPYVTEVTRTFLRIVIDNGRLALLPLLHEAYEEVVDKKSGRVRVLLEVTDSPDKSLLESIKKKMSTKTGHDVQLEYRVNSKLVKGFRIFYRNRLIDCSVGGRLRRLRTILKEGALK